MGWQTIRSRNLALLQIGLLTQLLCALPVLAADLPPTGQAEIPVAVEAEAEPDPPAESKTNETTFTIKRFVIEGSGLVPESALQQRLREFVGRKKTAADVEGAREALERFYHDLGYPTVLVNIPEQKVESRVIRLEVIENRIGELTISGNRWFSTAKIRRDLPALAPGEVLFLPRVQADINRLNRHPDFKVIPEMVPGKAPESVDFTLKVTDKLPLHGSLELNNRGSHDTTDLRLNGALRYDNLWQREHAISAQYQMSPKKLSEVEIASGSYTMPAPWNGDDRLVLYGVWSNTETAFGAGFSNLGKGVIIGSRAVMPLHGVGDYSHTAVAGVDYKEFEEIVGQAGIEPLKTPISYFPFSLNYSGSLRDSSGATQFSAGLNLAFRGAVTKAEQFADKRFKARGNYLTLTAGIERNQQLPGDFTLQVKLDGQLADQPLISNEGFTAGGVDSVRGYMESEASGDNAVHSLLELAGPDLFKSIGKERFSMTPYLFYDTAALWVKDPLPGQERAVELMGTGAGLRGTLLRNFEYQVDLAFALRDTNRTTTGDTIWHFKVLYQF